MIFEDSLYSQLTFGTSLGSSYGCHHLLQMGKLRLGSVKSSLEGSTPKVNARIDLQGLTGIPRTAKMCSFLCAPQLPLPLPSSPHQHKSLLPNTDISCLMKFSSRERTKPLGGQGLVYFSVSAVLTLMLSLIPCHYTPGKG